jgi:hypothetical protein
MTFINQPKDDNRENKKKSADSTGTASQQEKHKRKSVLYQCATKASVANVKVCFPMRAQ